MATSTGPDLTSARAAVEALMDDTCRVYAPADPKGGPMGADLRISVGDVGPQIYDGPCKFGDGPSAATGRYGQEGGKQLAFSGQKVDFPLDRAVGGQLVTTPVFPVGAVIEVTSSRRDPATVGLRFTVTEPKVKTMAVKRSVMAELRARAEG